MNQKTSGLGRGLSALIPEDEPAEPATVEGLFDLAVDTVHPNRYQPRTKFDEASLEALTASVRELGVLQPILVRPDGDGYELIAGERRWRAVKRAGLETVPALVRVVTDRASLEEAVVENLHRDDLNPLEEAAAYQQLIDEFELTQERVAERVGKSRSSITNTLRLLQLPSDVQRMLLDDELSAGHARALLAISGRAQLCALAERVINEDLSVRQTERLVRGEALDGEAPQPEPTQPAGRRSGPAPDKDPALLELEALLADHLDTRVALTMGPRNGRIVIDFADLDDLERIYRVLKPG